MKKIVCILSAIFLLTFSSTSFAANLDSNSEIEYFDDGSYIIITIENDFQTMITPFSNTITKSKTVKYYSGNVAKWYVKVTGSFTYGNGSAKCTKSTISAGSYTKEWKILSKSATKSGPTASASAIAKKYYNGKVTETIVKTVKLTCSPTGKFS
ncbi:MAG: hypothetical protein HFH03_01345 [Dorea sp.]|nr:hypothetical protein [Dorea sp.]